MNFWPKLKENALFSILLALLIIVIGVTLALVSRNQYKQNYFIGKNPQIDRTIDISGEGKVTAIPDIAILSLGMENNSLNIQDAQKKNSDTMNSLVSQLKALQISPDDIKTSNYSINPQYDWNNGQQTLRGYSVSQNITVKIRKTDLVDQVLKIAGDLKLNQVGGLSFDIDNPELYQQQAREKALENAKAKAEALAKIMGVKLGKVISFSEYNSYAPTPYPMYASKEASMGIGGGTAPSVAPGSQEIVITASVRYELD